MYIQDFGQHLEDVLQLLQHQQRKIKPCFNTCNLFKSEVHIIDKVIAADRNRIHEHYIVVVQTLKDKAPSTVREVKTFLGFQG